MRTSTVPLFVLLATSLAAQSNSVNGLDGRLTVIDNMSHYGRRGPAQPNGEIGMAMLNTMCNPGSVNIPWFAAMQPNHPKFGFMVARVADDRIEQINEWSYCKHAFLSINVNGACGQCQNPGTGALMGLNCADTYAPSNNASRTWLGPPEEINPWLGTWDPIGSYFDIGDPAQSGYPAPSDGVRSLSQTIFDSVDNRITVDEIDLTTLGAKYYYGLESSIAVLVSGMSNTAHNGTPLPTLLPGTSGCDVLVAADALDAVLTTAAGTANAPITVPNTSSMIGLQAYHQWAVWDPTVNALGIVVSRGARATVGN